jgi:ABC-type antimicrobial peptide transport system permease subunit
LSLANEEIVELLEKFDKEAKAIKHDLLSICWYMRGSISYDDAFMLTSEDREIISKIIEGNLETTKESGLPFF